MPSLLKLDNRAVVRLKGTESRSLLQGLITNDIELLTPEAAMYAALLTPQGKFLFDMIIAVEGDDLLLDVEAGRKADFLRRLMMYKLRSDVEIVDDDRAVWALFDGDVDVGVVYADPRHPDMQKRVISAENPAPDADALDHSAYEETRLRLGVPDGSNDMKVEKDFWLETDAERLNGVSFTKGCFVGQELTARMKHRMTLKKKFLPVMAIDGDLMPGAAIKTENGKSAGDIRSANGRVGIAYMRLEYLDDALTADGVAINPVSSQLPAG